MRINPRNESQSESGNVIIFILIAIVLIGLVTAAIRSGGGEGANIDKEQALLQATQMRQYASELERGVTIILQNGVSETDIRFAHGDADPDYGDIADDPAHQVFSRTGGGVEYRTVPDAVNGGLPWEFFAETHMPGTGSEGRAELAAVLPDVADAVCAQLNKLNGLPEGETPEDDGACVSPGTAVPFNGTNTFEDTAPNTMVENTFSRKPALEACVACDDGKNYFYHVLIGR